MAVRLPSPWISRPESLKRTISRDSRVSKAQMEQRMVAVGLSDRSSCSKRLGLSLGGAGGWRDLGREGAERQLGQVQLVVCLCTPEAEKIVCHRSRTFVDYRAT
jgi:hypothetical protein